MTTRLEQIYTHVKQEAPELYSKCIEIATAIAHNHYYAWGKHDELSLMASIEAAMMDTTYRALSEHKPLS